MTTAVADRPMLINLTIPDARIRAFGAVILDPVKVALGRSLTEVLATVLDGPVTQRPHPSGRMLDVFPLRIQDGDELLFPVPVLQGDLGFGNEAGHLVLTVPNAVASRVLGALHVEIASQRAVGPRIYDSPNGGMNADFGIAIVPGVTRHSFNLGSFGELGIEAR